MYKKIIPCLDVKNGRVVKGVNFVDFKDAGDPVEIAKAYNEAGADELVFLDISATIEERDTTFDLVGKVVNNITVPLCLGGGIKSIEDVRKAFAVGVNKISINSAAVNNPDLIQQASEEFGKESIVIAIDVKKNEDDKSWNVYTNAGFNDTGLDAIEWAIRVESLGAGEILLTSMDGDGTKDGYDIEITKAIAEAVSIPVTASGGAGSMEDFYKAFTETKVAAALAASLFHFKEIEIGVLKKYLKDRGIEVREN